MQGTGLRSWTGGNEVGCNGRAMYGHPVAVQPSVLLGDTLLVYACPEWTWSVEVSARDGLLVMRAVRFTCLT